MVKTTVKIKDVQFASTKECTFCTLSSDFRQSADDQSELLCLGSAHGYLDRTVQLCKANENLNTVINFRQLNPHLLEGVMLRGLFYLLI